VWSLNSSQDDQKELSGWLADRICSIGSYYIELSVRTGTKNKTAKLSHNYAIKGQHDTFVNKFYKRGIELLTWIK